MRFSPRAGDATIFKKIASPSQAKNRSCSRGLITNVMWICVTSHGLAWLQVDLRDYMAVHNFTEIGMTPSGLY